MNLPQIISSPTFNWLPPVIISTFMFIAALIGFMNGWKSALYFFAVNILGLTIGVFTFPIFWEKMQAPINNLLPKEIDLNEVVILAKAPLLAIYAFFIMIVIIIFSLIPYFIVRKKFFKKTIREKKEAKQSNIISRSIGSGIAIISVAPYAGFMASTSTVVSPPTPFSEMSDTLTRAFTFGKAKNISKDYDDAIALFDLTNPQSVEEVENIFKSFVVKSGQKAESEAVIIEKLKKKKEQIQAIINRPILVSKFIKSLGQKGQKLSSQIRGIKSEKEKEDAITKMQKANISITKEKLDFLLKQLSN